MKEISRRAGAGFAVILIPDEVQVDPALQEEVTHASGRSREALNFERPNRLLRAALAEKDVATLDLLPTFMQEGRTTRLYKPQDTHWNIAGNRLAATAMA